MLGMLGLFHLFIILKIAYCRIARSRTSIAPNRTTCVIVYYISSIISYIFLLTSSYRTACLSPRVPEDRPHLFKKLRNHTPHVENRPQLSYVPQSILSSHKSHKHTNRATKELKHVIVSLSVTSPYVSSIILIMIRIILIIFSIIVIFIFQGVRRIM